MPTGDVRCVGAATEGRGRADEAEAAEGRISWEPPGLSTERMLRKGGNELVTAHTKRKFHLVI